MAVSATAATAVSVQGTGSVTDGSFKRGAGGQQHAGATSPRWCAKRVGVVQGCPDVEKPDPLQHGAPERQCRIGYLLKRHDVGLTDR